MNVNTNTMVSISKPTRIFLKLQDLSTSTALL